MGLPGLVLSVDLWLVSFVPELIGRHCHFDLVTGVAKVEIEEGEVGLGGAVRG